VEDRTGTSTPPDLVEFVDTILGSVLQRLDSLDTYDESLIVVLSDHGDTSPRDAPLSRVWGGHEGRVSLFIRAPYQEVAESTTTGVYDGCLAFCGLDARN
jgi:arylsulfatase A-like enzyme